MPRWIVYVWFTLLIGWIVAAVALKDHDRREPDATGEPIDGGVPVDVHDHRELDATVEKTLVPPITRKSRIARARRPVS